MIEFFGAGSKFFLRGGTLVIRTLFQKLFSFEEENKDKIPKTENSREALSECFALLRLAQNQQDENLQEEALANLEKVIDIIEREGIFK